MAKQSQELFDAKKREEEQKKKEEDNRLQERVDQAMRRLQKQSDEYERIRADLIEQLREEEQNIREIQSVSKIPKKHQKPLFWASITYKQSQPS